MLTDNMPSQGIVGFAVSVTTPRMISCFSLRWVHKGDLREPGRAGAILLNFLNCELNKSLCFIKMAFLRYFNSVMEKINRETQYAMEYDIYLYSCLCYCGSMLLPSTARKYFSTYCLLREKNKSFVLNLHEFCNHVSSQKYLKLNYHNLENICIKMLVLRQTKLCQISSGFLQKLWTRFHALVFAIYNCSRLPYKM